MGRHKRRMRPAVRRKWVEQHPRQRALERYGLTVSKHDIEAITRLIQKRKSVNARKQTDSRTRHDVFYNGRWWRVIYSNRNKLIVTVLPFEEDDGSHQVETAEAAPDSGGSDRPTDPTTGPGQDDLGSVPLSERQGMA